MSAPAPGLFDLVAGRPITPGPGLVRSAQEHKLGGLLLAAREDRRATIEGDRLYRLAAADADVRSHHALLWDILGVIVDDLAAEGLEVAALKGVTSEFRWYGTPGHRPSVDLDLWLAPDHIGRLGEVLALLAPEYPMPEEAVDLARRRLLQHVHFEFDEVTIDLHLDPLKLGVPSRVGPRMWATSELLGRPDGGTVRVLSPAAALALALLHLNKDRFAYLGGYEEIRRIAADPDLDWEEFGRLVAGDGLAVPVWCTLPAVAGIVPLDLPTPPPTLTRWRVEAWERLWPPASRLQGDEGLASRPHRQRLIPALLTGRAGEAVAEWRRFMFPPRSLLDVHDPDRRDRGYVRRLTVDRLVHRVRP